MTKSYTWYMRPVLFVSDVQRAIEFYVGKLGFEKKWHEADGKGTVCQVDRGGCEIILCEDADRNDRGRLFLELSRRTSSTPWGRSAYRTSSGGKRLAQQIGGIRGPAMGVTVRRAELRDASELARLRWEFRPEDQPNQSLDEFTREFEKWFGEASSSDWMAAVADDGGGALVGCVFLRSVTKVPNPGARDRAWGYVTNSYVAPAHRGQGVGGKLLEVVIAAARERGHEFLIVWPSEEALSLYARAGFREVPDVHRGPDDYPPLELLLS